MKKIYGFIYVSFLIFCTECKADSHKDTLNVGFYVNDIYDIDYKKGTYKISLFIWTNSYTRYYNLKDYLDIHNQVSFETERYYEDTLFDLNKRKVFWTEIRGTAEIIQPFDVTHYPFDKEQLRLSIEFTYEDYKNLFINIDSTTILTKAKIPSEWKSNNPKIFKHISFYATSFGDPLSREYNIQTVDIVYDLFRDSRKLFIKLFVAMFISFLIACSSIFISNSNFEPRFSLIVGGLFGTIGNKYVTESYLPESSSFNLSDKLHFVTIFFLLILTILTIVENRMELANNKKFEKASFLLTLLTYTGTVLYFIFYN
jgi:hypothetical protein